MQQRNQQPSQQQHHSIHPGLLGNAGSPPAGGSNTQAGTRQRSLVMDRQQQQQAHNPPNAFSYRIQQQQHFAALQQQVRGRGGPNNLAGGRTLPGAATNSTSTNNISAAGHQLTHHHHHHHHYAGAAGGAHHQQNNSTAHLVGTSSSNVVNNAGAPTEASSAVTRAQQRINQLAQENAHVLGAAAHHHLHMHGHLGQGHTAHHHYHHHVHSGHGGVAHLHIHAGQPIHHAATMGAQAAGGLATATNAQNPAAAAVNGANGSHQFNYVYSDGSEEEVDSESKSSNNGKAQYISEDEFEFPKLIPLRAQTAPARPLTEIEEFRRSSDFLLLENTVMMSDHLKQRTDQKYDLDSEDGQRACKRFLNQIERLCEVFKAPCASRTYRENFSKAYKVLYKEGSLCYLTEILDSAQEGFPYLWVNGEKYVFSHEVLEAGRKLFQQFRMIQNIIRNLYERIIEDTVNITVQYVMEDMAKHLEEFDATWTAYEQIYVLELMLIEADARRYITEAIETERDLAAIEQKEKARGRIVFDTVEYTEKRSKLIQILGKINSVANPEGMGRDDLGNEILLAAEGIYRRISPTQSKAVRNLAERIKKIYQDFKSLLRKYEQNIEVVDPQLKNNNELVEILVEFENSWSQGLTYFLDGKKCNQLLHFSQVIEATAEKHKQFAEQLEQRDAEIFFIIPSLLILKSLENDDKDICMFFFPDMGDENTDSGKQMTNLKKVYENGRKKHGMYDFYNLMEKCLIEVKLEESEKQVAQELDVEKTLVKDIKGLAMLLSRFKPADWNKFLDVVIK